LLLVAELLEIGWTTGLYYTDSFTRLWLPIATLSAAWLSFCLFVLTVRQIPSSKAYAIWIGIETMGVAMFEIPCFEKPASMVRMLFILSIVAGIMGLTLSSTPH